MIRESKRNAPVDAAAVEALVNEMQTKYDDLENEVTSEQPVRL